MARILIADDASFMRQMIREIIEPEGHEVVGEATNGIEAVEQYEEKQPDLVTMDIVMPKRSGIDAVKGILAEHPNARIVMCSALGQETLVMEALQAGAKDFIEKPWENARLLSIVNNALALAKSQQVEARLNAENRLLHSASEPPTTWSTKSPAMQSVLNVASASSAV